jgi:leader peptidase (prepilin peptidase)/N-methyltransferase
VVAVAGVAALGCAGAGAAVGPALAAGARRIPGVAGGPVRMVLVSAVSMVVFGAIGYRLVPDPDDRLALPAFLVLAAAGITLAVIDLDVRRLPDAITLPAYPVIAALLTAATLLTDPTRGALEPLGRAVLGALASVLLYGLLSLPRSSQMGFGDVKLAGLLGLALGWLSWSVLAAGVVLGFGYGALYALGLLVTRRARWRSRVPFGPAMLAGAFTAVLVGDWLAAAYTSV